MFPRLELTLTRNPSVKTPYIHYIGAALLCAFVLLSHPMAKAAPGSKKNETLHLINPASIDHTGCHSGLNRHLSDEKKIIQETAAKLWAEIISENGGLSGWVNSSIDKVRSLKEPGEFKANVWEQVVKNAKNDPAWNPDILWAMSQLKTNDGVDIFFNPDSGEYLAFRNNGDVFEGKADKINKSFVLPFPETI